MIDLRCHRCSMWIGEVSQPMELVGMFVTPHDRKLVDPPRESIRCKSCGWVNVFRRLAASPTPHLETKALTASGTVR